MGSQHAIPNTPVQEDEYFADVFSDDRFLLESLDPDDLLTDAFPANQEIWDVLDISDEEWADAQPDGFFMY